MPPQPVSFEEKRERQRKEARFRREKARTARREQELQQARSSGLIRVIGDITNAATDPDLVSRNQEVHHKSVGIAQPEDEIQAQKPPSQRTDHDNRPMLKRHLSTQERMSDLRRKRRRREREAELAALMEQDDESSIPAPRPTQARSDRPVGRPAQTTPLPVSGQEAVGGTTAIDVVDSSSVESLSLPSAEEITSDEPSRPSTAGSPSDASGRTRFMSISRSPRLALFSQPEHPVAAVEEPASDSGRHKEQDFASSISSLAGFSDRTSDESLLESDTSEKSCSHASSEGKAQILSSPARSGAQSLSPNSRVGLSPSVSRRGSISGLSLDSSLFGTTPPYRAVGALGHFLTAISDQGGRGTGDSLKAQG